MSARFTVLLAAAVATGGLAIALAFGLPDGSRTQRSTVRVIGAHPLNRVYDRTTNATVDFSGASLNGVVGSDTVTIDSSGYSASFANKTVGTAKPVRISGITLSGAVAGRYVLIQPTGKATIAAKTLTITGTVANDKAYDSQITFTSTSRSLP